MISRSTEGHKKVICKRCEVKKVKKQKWANDPLALMVANADAFVHIFLVYSGVLISEIKIIVSFTEPIFKNGEYPFFIFFHFTLLTNDLLVTFS